MAEAPLRPYLLGVRSEHVRRLRQTIADYANHKLANSSTDWVTLKFGDIALELGVDRQQVCDAIGEDGGNGIGVRIRPEVRERLAHYIHWPLSR